MQSLEALRSACGSGPTISSLKLHDYPRLSTGNDSNVYKVGRHVAKEYQKLSFAEVARYADLQNRAVEALAAMEYHAEILMRGETVTLSAVEAIAVDDLLLSSSGLPLTLSKFVPEANVEKLMWRPDRYCEWADRELTDASLRAFADELNSFFWEEYPTRVGDEIHYHLATLSRRLDEVLGVSGLYISKYNAKLRPRTDSPGFDMIITDVALYIDRVRYHA